MARLLASGSDRAVHLEADVFFDFIRSGFVEPWRAESREQNIAVMGIVTAAAGAYADAGYFTILEGIVSPRWFFEPVRDGLRARGHDVAFAVLQAPPDVCVARVNARLGARPAAAAVVKRVWAEFADLGSLEDHAIDSQARPPEEIAAEIGRRLNADLLVA